MMCAESERQRSGGTAAGVRADAAVGGVGAPASPIDSSRHCQHCQRFQYDIVTALTMLTGPGLPPHIPQFPLGAGGI